MAVHRLHLTRNHFDPHCHSTGVLEMRETTFLYCHLASVQLCVADTVGIGSVVPVAIAVRAGDVERGSGSGCGSIGNDSSMGTPATVRIARQKVQLVRTATVLCTIKQLSTGETRLVGLPNQALPARLPGWGCTLTILQDGTLMLLLKPGCQALAPDQWRACWECMQAMSDKKGSEAHGVWKVGAQQT